MKRPDCWNRAMDFLGEPEAPEVEEYVTWLETRLAKTVRLLHELGWTDEAIERDAARYRWLRLALSDQTSKGKSHWFCSITRGRPDELDAAIDAAREQEDKP